MDAPSPEQILSLYDELGRPSAAKFRLALRRRLGLNVSVEDVQRIVGLQSERQILAPPPKYDGKIFSLGIDEKWVAHVMVLPSDSSVTHVLVVQDVFSRYLWAKPMLSQAAVVEPMRQIMKTRKPEVLYTDADTAFQSAVFQQAMRELGVDARIKTGRNDIATVDRAIGMLKETIVKYRSTTGQADWAKHLEKAVKAFNSNDLEYLMREAPEDVKKGTDLEFMLKRKNFDFAQHNVRLLAKKTNRLTDRGHFRAYLAPPRTKGWRRVGEARWSPEIHAVERIEREMVVDTQGSGTPSRRCCRSRRPRRSSSWSAAGSAWPRRRSERPWSSRATSS